MCGAGTLNDTIGDCCVCVCVCVCYHHHLHHRHHLAIHFNIHLLHGLLMDNTVRDTI